MVLRPWRKISESVVFTNPWWSYRLDRIELPSGKPGEYHYLHTEGSAMVVPITASGDLIMVRQFRYLVGRESLEFPGGGVKPGTTHAQAARDELAEETGLAAAELRRVGGFNPFNGVTDEMCHVFVARGLEPARELTPDETEEIETVCVAPEELDARIRSGEVWDGMTIAAWFLARGDVG
jgi:ADP-ribose pyrophosphatase